MFLRLERAPPESPGSLMAQPQKLWDTVSPFPTLWAVEGRVCHAHGGVGAIGKRVSGALSPDPEAAPPSSSQTLGLH